MPDNFQSDPDVVFNMAFSIHINQKKLKKIEKDYNTRQTKENEDEMEIRVFKMEQESKKLKTKLSKQEER